MLNIWGKHTLPLFSRCTTKRSPLRVRTEPHAPLRFGWLARRCSCTRSPSVAIICNILCFRSTTMLMIVALRDINVTGHQEQRCWFRSCRAYLSFFSPLKFTRMGVRNQVFLLHRYALRQRIFALTIKGIEHLDKTLIRGFTFWFSRTTNTRSFLKPVTMQLLPFKCGALSRP